MTVTVKSQQEASQISTETNEDTTFVMHKSPWGAIARSALIPGWGQIYNKSYWKAPVVWGFLGYFMYIWNDSNQLYWDWKKLYSESLANSPAGNRSYRNKRDFYRDQRDEFAVYIGLTYFLNLIDAYVDAHLFDFTVKENNFLPHPELVIKIKL